MSKENNLSEYYRKASGVIRIIRYCTLLLFILFLITIMFSYRNSITLDNLQYLMKYADLYSSSQGEDASEISISSNSDSQYLMLRNNLCVVSRNGVDMYDFTNGKLFNYSFSYSYPAFVNDDRNVLVYDIEGTEISIFNSFSKVYTQKYPYSVKAAAINKSGFAVVTNEESYRSGVIVYNDKYKEVFRWMTHDKYVTTLDISKDASFVVCSAVNADDGGYDSSILLYNTITGKCVNQLRLSDELPISIKYSPDSKRIIIITDSMVYFYDSGLQKGTTYKFNQSKVNEFKVLGDKLILTQNTSISGNSMLILGFDFSGNNIFSIETTLKIDDVAICDNYLYAIGEQKLCVYEFSENYEIRNLDILLTDSLYESVLADSENRFIITNSKKAQRNSPQSIRTAKDKETSNENIDNR